MAVQTDGSESLESMADVWQHALPCFLGFLGCWLFLYRTVIWMRRCRQQIQVLTMMFACSSWALLGPLLPWPTSLTQWYRAPIMVFFGLFLGCLGNLFGPLVVSVALGASFGATFWHIAFCSDSVAWSLPHALTLLFSTVAIAFPITLTKCGPKFWENCIIPVLGALLLTIAAADLRPELRLGLTTDSLFAEPCLDSDSLHRSLKAWGALTFAGMVIQGLLRMIPTQPDDRVPGEGSVAESLLHRHDEENGAGVLGPDAPDTTGGNERHPLIVEAIHDLDFDMSRLEEHERRMVQTCRDNEEEKYRIMFGGGLY